MPTLILLGGILYLLAGHAYFRAEAQGYVTDSQARPDKSLEQKWYTDKSYEVAIEKISSDLENGHWAKADHELHSLKLTLEGK